MNTSILFPEILHYGEGMDASPTSRNDERTALAARLRLAGPELELAAASLASHDEGDEHLDEARVILLDRLHRHSDDFAATAALQTLTTFSAGLRADSLDRKP